MGWTETKSFTNHESGPPGWRFGPTRSSRSSRVLQVAEAFLDCQAVQARVVERVGLELLGVSQMLRDGQPP